MPSIARILELAPVCCYLAANHKNKKALFGGTPKSAKNQSTLIYIYWKILNKIYTLDPNYPGLDAPAQYLYELEQPWAYKAASIVDGGGGGSVTPVTPATVQYPFYITSSDFESDGVTYINSKIANTDISLFINQYTQQFFPGTEFTYIPSGGFVITAPGFDASQYDYTIRVEKYYPIPS